MNDNHIPVPSEHSPRKETIQQTDETMTVFEVDNPKASITSDMLVEVRQ